MDGRQIKKSTVGTTVSRSGMYYAQYEVTLLRNVRFDCLTSAVLLLVEKVSWIGVAA